MRWAGFRFASTGGCWLGWAGACRTFEILWSARSQFPRVDGLQVAADGCLGGLGPVLCARWGGERSSPVNMAFDYKDVYKVFILYV